MKTQVHIKEKAFESFVSRKGITYKELAERMDVTRVYMSNIKRENMPEYRPSGALRENLMKELGCKFDDIFEIRKIKDKAPRKKTKK